MADFEDELELIQKRGKQWRDDRRAVSEQVWNTKAGKWFIYYLLEDMRFFDEVTLDPEIVMRNFAVQMLQQYFGVMTDKKNHRSMLLEAMMRVEKPEGEENE